MRIPESIISQLNEKADLVAIIRRHTELKPAGREFRGCCPFHGEKTPSFYVNPESNLYYCFGCGAKGNAIRFLVDFERMTFVEAVKELSNKTGIDLPKENNEITKYRRTSTQKAPTTQRQLAKPQNSTPSSAHTDTKSESFTHSDNGTTNIKNHGESTHNSQNSTLTAHSPSPLAHAINDTTNTYDGYDSEYFYDHHTQFSQYDDYVVPETLGSEHGDLYTLLGAVNKFYQSMLIKYPAAKHYFLDRGIAEESIQTFELGYAPSDWQHLETVFADDIEGLKILGLIKTSQKGKSFNLFRDRVIFPIKDRQGRVVGFAGRALSDEVKPKYINSSDSIIFQKQHILYGYYESRQAKASDWLMVEGYMDVISLYQANIFGAVAPMGTAVNQGQIELLLKFNDELTLCFDGDNAGQRAALRALEVAMPVLPDGKTLKFLTLNDNHDPDTFVKTYGADAMRQAIHRAISISDYLYQVLSKKYDTTSTEQKAAAMAELKSLTAKLPKGSSFRSLLNSDLYRRLSFFQKNKNPANHINHNRKISVVEQLYLCLLYMPSLANLDRLDAIYQLSNIDDKNQALIKRFYDNQESFPPLPTIQDIDEDLSKLIEVIKKSSPYLLDVTNHANINANALFILSALDNMNLQTQLESLWQDFFGQVYGHKLESLDLFFDELLCESLMLLFTNLQKNSSNLLISKIHRNRELALKNWDKHQTKAQIQHLFDGQVSH